MRRRVLVMPLPTRSYISAVMLVLQCTSGNAVLAQEGQATTAIASANDRGDACTQSIEKVINLCIMRGVEKYRARALRLRAGWTQVDVYRGGNTFGRSGRSGRSARAGEKRSVSGNRLRDLTPTCSYCPDGRAERGAWRRCSCPCARIACIRCGAYAAYQRCRRR